MQSMKRTVIIEVLKAAEPTLRSKGVAHAALFGSFARSEHCADSDIDIMVEIEPGAELDVFGYVGIVHAIEDLFPIPVDVSNRRVMKPHVGPAAERDAIYAF